MADTIHQLEAMRRKSISQIPSDLKERLADFGLLAPGPQPVHSLGSNMFTQNENRRAPTGGRLQNGKIGMLCIGVSCPKNLC